MSRRERPARHPELKNSTDPDRSVDESAQADRSTRDRSAAPEPSPAPDPDHDAPTLLTEPADGIPEVIGDERSLMRCAELLAGGTGPVAVDAERASGYRYGQRAYLVQLRRIGSGTMLIDPIAVPDLSPVHRALDGVEWVLHAATQDLPCLAEVGMRPSKLFDTELGARLAGLPRVGLGAAVEHYLGLSLAKEHSAVDWSTRPLPEPWLRYAALDVEILVQLRDALEADLRDQDKLDWAQEEFDSLLSFDGPAQRTDPWRRTSGMHRLRRPRQLAAVRELWQARDAIARRRDTAPGRVLSDASLMALVADPPKDSDEWNRPEFRVARRNARVWLDALDRAQAMPDRDLPPASVPGSGPPPPRVWPDRDPVASRRLTASRAALTALGETRSLPVENLVQPDLLRRLLWNRGGRPLQDPAQVGEELRALGARGWQSELVAPLVVEAVAEADAAGGADQPASGASGRRRSPRVTTAADDAEVTDE